jgi:hypothetical protein
MKSWILVIVMLTIGVSAIFGLSYFASQGTPSENTVTTPVVSATSDNTFTLAVGQIYVVDSQHSLVYSGQLTQYVSQCVFTVIYYPNDLVLGTTTYQLLTPYPRFGITPNIMVGNKKYIITYADYSTVTLEWVN